MHSIKKRIWNIVEDFKRFEWLQFCLKEKCKNCRKYTFNCKDCFKEKCKNCDFYLKTKDILLNCKNKVTVNYVKSFSLIIVKFKIDLSFNFDFRIK